MTKPKLILDMDDVLADLISAWVHDVNAAENENVKVEEIKSWDINSYFNCGKKVFSYLTSELYSKLTPIKGSQEAVKLLSSKYSIYVCTIGTTYKQSLIPKVEWLEKYFPEIPISNLILLGDKSVIKGEIMIDDSPKNLEVFDGQKLLFDACHNKNEECFERVLDWEDVIRKLLN